MPPPLPRCSGGASSSLISPRRVSLPRFHVRIGLHIVLFEVCSAFRGRDGHCWPPPAQIRTCPIKASGSYLGCLTSKRMAAFRTRPSAWVTRSRPCVRSVLCCSAFPLVPGLGSTGSATGRPALFVGFIATMPESDFSGSCISGYGSSPSRYGPSDPNRAHGRSRDLPVPAQGASVHARV